MTCPFWRLGYCAWRSSLECSLLFPISPPFRPNSSSLSSSQGIPPACDVCVTFLALDLLFSFLRIICFLLQLIICLSRYFIHLYVSSISCNLQHNRFVDILDPMQGQKHMVLKEFVGMFLNQASQFTPSHPFKWTRRGGSLSVLTVLLVHVLDLHRGCLRRLLGLW